MSDFTGMEDLLQDFLIEAGDLLSGVDNKLVDLERSPDDRGLLNDIFRGFHTIKGGAGFLNAAELVTLCHLTENLFDKLRNGELSITPEAMDIILAATAGVREMFGHLEHGTQPPPADPALIAGLKATLAGNPVPVAVPVLLQSDRLQQISFRTDHGRLEARAVTGAQNGRGAARFFRRRAFDPQGSGRAGRTCPAAWLLY